MDGDATLALGRRPAVLASPPVYVLHAFQKKSNRGIVTPKRRSIWAQATQAGRARLQAMDHDRKNTMRRKKTTVTPGSGNVFADLGLSDAGAELVKAQLTYHIAKHIKALGLTQTQAT